MLPPVHSCGLHADALPLLLPAAAAAAGTGQNMFGLNWGNGFITDYNIINSRGLSDPNPFFASLVRKPYADKVRLGNQVLLPPETDFRVHGGS
jgi:hypothetical protein